MNKALTRFWKLAIALAIVAGCGASPTEPVEDAQPWVGVFLSDSTEFIVTTPSIVVVGGISLAADSTCVMLLTFGAEGVTASVESSPETAHPTTCTYSIHGQPGERAILLEGTVWVETPTAAGQDSMKFFAYPATDYSYLAWVIYQDHPPLILERQ